MCSGGHVARHDVKWIAAAPSSYESLWRCTKNRHDTMMVELELSDAFILLVIAYFCSRNAMLTMINYNHNDNRDYDYDNYHKRVIMIVTIMISPTGAIVPGCVAYEEGGCGWEWSDRYESFDLSVLTHPHTTTQLPTHRVPYLPNTERVLNTHPSSPLNRVRNYKSYHLF